MESVGDPSKCLGFKSPAETLLESRPIWSHVGIIFVHVQAPAQDYYFLPEAVPTASTAHDKLFCPFRRILSLRLMMLGIPAVILTSRYLKSVLWRMTE